ncbi:MAG: NAD(P)-dependent alcohol dehydrogenase [Turneriella sp.]|nr:NAD(P)-dependent alcohol dehydrogenase [Turneriella sp.]
MRAAVFENYGYPDVLGIRNVAKPTPKHNQILIRVHASAVNSADWRLRKPDPWGVRLFLGLRRPRIKILGGVFSGTVEAVGSSVTRFRAGDRIFGSTGLKFGAYADFLCLPENATVVKFSDRISFGNAAALSFGYLTACHYLRKAQVSRGQHLMVYGASGSVGTAAVQMAKYLGAKVTAVTSAANTELMRSLGADRTLDYAGNDFKNDLTQYDVVLDAVGKTPWRDHLHRVKSRGALILVASGALRSLYLPCLQFMFRPRLIAGVITEKVTDLELVRDLAESKQIQPVIDKIFTLEEIAAAHRYVELGHKRGNVILQISDTE